MELLRKTMLAGIGLALKTKDEIESVGRDLVQRGELSEKEGKKFVAEILVKADETRRSLEARVEQTVQEVLRRADVVTKSELNGLKKEIRELKKAVGQPPDGQP